MLTNGIPALHQLLYLLPRGSERLLLVHRHTCFHLAGVRMLEREEVLRTILRRLIHVFGAQREPGSALRAESLAAFVHDLLLHCMPLWPVGGLLAREAASSTLELLSNTILPSIERVHDCVDAAVELLDALQVVRLVEVLRVCLEEWLQDVGDLSVGGLLNGHFANFLGEKDRRAGTLFRVLMLLVVANGQVAARSPGYLWKRESMTKQ